MAWIVGWQDKSASQGMINLDLRTIIGRIEKIAWALMLVALPLTSFPYFPRAIGGEALVRPVSLYPLLLLIPISILPKLFRKPLPKSIFDSITICIYCNILFSYFPFPRG